MKRCGQCRYFLFDQKSNVKIYFPLKDKHFYSSSLILITEPTGYNNFYPKFQCINAYIQFSPFPCELWCQRIKETHSEINGLELCIYKTQNTRQNGSDLTNQHVTHMQRQDRLKTEGRCQATVPVAGTLYAQGNGLFLPVSSLPVKEGLPRMRPVPTASAAP